MLWVGKSKRTDHGPHSEINFSAFVSESPEYPQISLNDNSFNLFQMFLNKEWQNRAIAFPLYIFNDTPNVVAYNDEFLKLSAELCFGL